MSHNKLDKTDRGLLELLQKNCRASLKTIAEQLYTSVTPIHVRTKRLEDEGIIRSYTAILNPRKVGLGLTVYTQVVLLSHSWESLHNFVTAVTAIPEVLECSHVSGKFDFLLKIIIGDMEAYNTLLLQQLSRLPGVDNMESLFVMSQPKSETAIPLKAAPTFSL